MSPFRQLEEQDYEVLESYWINFKDLVEQPESNPKRVESIKNIITAVTTLYNDSDGIMRDFIEFSYFDTENGLVNRNNAVTELKLTKNKVSILRKSLLEDTAKLIGWV